MRYGLILNILGLISKFLGILFVPSIIVALAMKEYSAILPFLAGIVSSLALGFLLNIKKENKKEMDNLKKSESLAVVVFAWVLFGFLSAIPYLFYNLNFTDACFEAFSGVTTTGATIFHDFNLYPKSLFFFRSSTQWLGGMGIVVLFIAILPKVAIAGRQMFYAEAPTPLEDKPTPRIRHTAGWFWGLYLAFTLIETIILHFLGLDFFDSLTTSISTISTGGFSPHAHSILGFNNPSVSICVLLFMFLGGINYILIYRSLKSKKPTPFFKSEEFKAYFSITLFLASILALSLFFNSNYPLKKAFLHSFFEIIATITTTGFAIDNYVNWDSASKVILFVAFFLGGCATSTSGGIKIIRWVFIGKYLKRELNKNIHPQGVYPLKLEGATVENDVVSQIMAFIILYLVIFAFGAFLIILIENNITLALSSSAAAIGNIGLGFGIIGPMGEYSSLHFVTKWILIFLMLIGRLEIIPFLAILNKDLWKN